MAGNLQDSAGVLQKQEDDAIKHKYLTFWVDGQLFGVCIRDVEQIIRVEEITQVPEFPHYAKGIINLRGNIIPIIDVRLWLGKMENEYDERACIIISRIRDKLIGFMVDTVDEVTDIPDEEFSPTPQLSNYSSQDEYIVGIGKHEGNVVLILDMTRILGDSDLEQLNQLNSIG